MLTATYPFPWRNPGAFTAMTFRVYLRWPGQRVSDKTVTESRAVAETAFAELAGRADVLANQGALGVSFTEDGKQIDYRRFGEDVEDGAGPNG